MEPVSAPRRDYRSLALAAILFVLNAYIAHDLFTAEFTRQYGSIESSFISYAAYALKNWGDLTWYPLWYGGTPFHQVYQPGFHLTVAGVAGLFGWTPQHAYHFVTAITYSLGPVTVFWLCRGVTGRRAYAFAAGLVYSLISTIALFSGPDGRDVGGPFHPRRFQILVQYGEGPHLTAVMLMPIVILCLYRAVVQRKPLYFPVASVALACLVLTNWPGTIGLTMAIAAFCLSEIGEKRLAGLGLAWLRLAAIAIVAYLLACRWIPPSLVRLVLGNAQQSDGNHFHVMHLVYLGALALVLGLAQFSLRRAGAPPFLRFGIYLSFLTGLVTLGRVWFHVDLLPQPNRFQVEFEVGIAITACYLGMLLFDRLPRTAAMVLAGILLLLTIPLIKSNRRYAKRLDAPMDMRATSEYKMAQEFAQIRPTDRVLAPGNISFWMNLWTDTPQISGCCDQGVPDFEHRVSDYVIYTGDGAGDKDAEISLVWLRAYGATAVGTDGPQSTEMYKPFRKPFKFEGVLPELWRDGDDIIYDIPTRARSLAHVIPPSAIITRAPENGLDIEPLQPYVGALENPDLPLAKFQWTSRHSAVIDTSMTPEQVLSVQVSYDAGWNAKVDGANKPILRDKLGQMVVETGCNGPCQIQMLYDGGTQARLMPPLQILGVLLALAGGYWPKRRDLLTPRS